MSILFFLHTSAPTTTDTRKEIQNHSLKHRIGISLQPFQKVKQSYWNWIDYLKPTSPYSFHFNQIYHHLHILPLMRLSAIISVRATRVLSASRLIPSEWPHAWTYNKWTQKIRRPTFTGKPTKNSINIYKQSFMGQTCVTSENSWEFSQNSKIIAKKIISILGRQWSYLMPDAAGLWWAHPRWCEDSPASERKPA